jgi:glycerate kinase
VRVLAAPDKFKGTAGAAAVAAAIATAAGAAGWDCDQVPLADGGDGLLEICPGELRSAKVSGPDGRIVDAEWKWVPARGSEPPTAVVEMARASGLVLAGGSSRNDAIAATTKGSGELIARAIAAGAKRVMVGCGGSATTDGGLGALEAIQAAGGLDGAELLVACDVSTRFVDAARLFGPQKGADPAAVEYLGRRLEELRARYLDDFGVDVDTIAGSGAAGGLAGALAALGAELVPGFDLVALLTGLDSCLERADLVVTGEGRLDVTSLQGKVVSGILSRLVPAQRALVVVGDSDLSAAALRGILAEGAAEPTVVSLVQRYGRERAFKTPLRLITETVGSYLAAWR